MIFFWCPINHFHSIIFQQQSNSSQQDKQLVTNHKITLNRRYDILRTKASFVVLWNDIRKMFFYIFGCFVWCKIIVNISYFPFNWKLFFNLKKFFKTINNFSTLNISFLNRWILPRPTWDLPRTCLGPLGTPPRHARDPTGPARDSPGPTRELPETPLGPT